MRAVRIAREFTSRLGYELSLYRDARRAARYPNAIFIWIPKTAGTSIYEMLRAHHFAKLKRPREADWYFLGSGRVTFGHMPLPELVSAGLVEQSFVDSSIKFCVVRDPYTRAVSLYNYLSRRGRFANWRRFPTLTEFLGLLETGLYDKTRLKGLTNLSICNPQSEWTKDIDLDLIIRMEDLPSYIPRLGQLLGCDDLQLPHENRSEGISVANLTDEDIRLIERVYQADFEAFGYPMALSAADTADQIPRYAQAPRRT